MGRSSEWTETDRLVLAQAVQNAVGPIVDKKDPASLRHKLDEDMRRAYEETGGKGGEARLLGHKVGSYSVSTYKAEPERRDVHVVCDDPQALEEWLLGNTLTMAAWIQTDAALDEFTNWVLQTTGEVPSGCMVTETVRPARPERFKTTTLKVDTAKVAEVMQGQLPAAVAGLLGGEAE